MDHLISQKEFCEAHGLDCEALSKRVGVGEFSPEEWRVLGGFFLHSGNDMEYSTKWLDMPPQTNWVVRVPLELLPLLISHPYEPVMVVVRWRLRIGR